MPNAAIVAAALTTGVQAKKLLYVAGRNVLVKPGGGGFGTPIDSIDLTENGPGAVSDMTFVIEDPLLEITINDGDEVRYVHVFQAGGDVPLFLGYVMDWTISPAFGGQGRIYTVHAMGIEAMLDWARTTADIVFANGSVLLDCIQTLASAVVGAPGLRWFSSPGLSSRQEFPVAGTTSTVTLTDAVTITAGTTLRDGIKQVSDTTIASGGFGAGATIWAATVDFWRGLRVYPDDATGGYMADGYFMTVTDTYAGPNQTSDLEYTTEGVEIKGVYIKGGNALGSGLLMDGSGKPGPIAFIEDAAILTYVNWYSRAAAYLTQYATSVRGSFTLQDVVPADFLSVANQFRPGSQAFITDTPVGLTGTARNIFAINKTFKASGLEDWTLSFGGLRASFAKAIFVNVRLHGGPDRV